MAPRRLPARRLRKLLMVTGAAAALTVGLPAGAWASSDTGSGEHHCGHHEKRHDHDGDEDHCGHHEKRHDHDGDEDHGGSENDD